MATMPLRRDLPPARCRRIKLLLLACRLRAVQEQRRREREEAQR